MGSWLRLSERAGRVATTLVQVIGHSAATNTLARASRVRCEVIGQAAGRVSTTLV